MGLNGTRACSLCQPNIPFNFHLKDQLTMSDHDLCALIAHVDDQLELDDNTDDTVPQDEELSDV